jgi:hypothetical protein
VSVDIKKRGGDNESMNWKQLIEEIQAADKAMTQQAIGRAVGRSQAWVADILSGRYDDLKWRDGEALRALHTAKVSPADTAQPEKEAA